MSETCNQTGCNAPAIALFTWPGKRQAGICEKHKSQLCDVANAMGLYIQMIPLESAELFAKKEHP